MVRRTVSQHGAKIFVMIVNVGLHIYKVHVKFVPGDVSMHPSQLNTEKIPSVSKFEQKCHLFNSNAVHNHFFYYIELEGKTYWVQYMEPWGPLSMKLMAMDGNGIVQPFALPRNFRIMLNMAVEE